MQDIIIYGIFPLEKYDESGREKNSRWMTQANRYLPITSIQCLTLYITAFHGGHWENI